MIGSSKSLSGFDPRTIPGCQVWLDGADQSSMTLSGSNVTQWSDKSGNGFNANAYTGVAAPVYSQSARTITFNGTNYFYTNYPSNPTNESIFIIFNSASVSAGNLIEGNKPSGGGARQIAFTTSGGNFNANASGVTAGPSISGYLTGVTYIGECFITSGSTQLYINGQNPSSSVSLSFTAGNTTNIGAFTTSQNGTPNYLYSGTISEILIYNTALGTTQRQQVEGYLAHKWGLVPYYDSSTPLTIPGCQLWLDAADPTSVLFSSGSNVSRWNDKSGQGNHSFALVSPRPDVTYSSNKIVFSAGNQNGLSNSTLTLPATSYSLFSVFSNTTSSYGGFNYPVFSGYGGSAAFGVFDTTGNIYVGPNQAALTTLSPAVSALGSTALLSLTSSGSSGTTVTFPNTGANLQQNTANTLTGPSTASSALTGISCVMAGAYLVAAGNPGILGSLLTPNASAGIWYAAVYDSTNIKMVRLSYTQGTPNTVSATDARYAVFSAVPTNANIQGYWDSGTSTDYANTSSANGYGVQSLLWSVSGASGTVTPYVNGSAKTTISAATFPSTGYRLSTGVAGAGFIGSISEIILYNSALTTSQRETIERYLMKKWAIGTNPTIPSTHPFSSIRPHLRAFQPTDIDGCQLWLDAADASTVTLSGSNVTQWIDKSGNGNNATPYSTSPQRVGNSVLFSGSNALKCGKFLTSTTYSAFIVNNFASGFSNNISLGCWKVQYGSSVIFQDGSIRAGVNNSGNYNVDASNSTASYTTNRIYGLTLSSSSTPGSAFTFNGSIDGSNVSLSGTSASGNATTCAQELTIGGLMEDSIAKYQLNGYVYEVVVFNSALTTSQRQTIEGYLAHKWGLTPTYATNTPLTIPGCTLWLDGADPLGNGVIPSDGTSISPWYDKSVSGYNAIIVNNPAVLKRNIQNSNSVMRFNSTRYSVTYPSFPSTGYTFFVVMYLSTNSGSYQRIINGSFSDQYLFIGTNSGSIATFNGNGTWNDINANWPPITNFQTWRIVTVTVGSSVLTPYVDGTRQDTKTGTTAAFSNLYIGDSGQHYFGDIGEILVYNSVLTTSQRQTIERYLARKWGLTVSGQFLSTHPFNRIPPATSAHFSPTSITGCQMWLDAADPSVVTIATGVSQWNDKSGNSNNLTQSTTGSQPTYASSLITFANDKYLNIPATVLNNLPTWSLFFVINPISTSNWIMSRQRDFVDSYNILSMTLSSTNYGGVQSGSAGFLYWRSMNAGTQLGSSDSLATSTLQTCTLTYDGTILYFYKNGELNQATTGSFAIQNQTSPNTYTLGALIYPSGIANPGVTNFRLGEMISYNTFLTTSQRERVEGYLSHKWGLLSSLSSINPYKTLPPIFPPIIQYNIIATGGTIVSAAGTTYHVFRTSSSFVVRRSVTVNYLVVGGGGGGGDRHGGGGGAGGVLSGNWSASAGTYIITVGAGGQYGSTNEGGQIAYGTPNGSGTKGGDSLLSGTGISITAYGGGGGGSYDGNPSGTVGSGGGGGGQNLSGVAGTAGQGNAGGSGSNPGAGGGGGAGGAGVAANTGTGGVGTSSYSTHLLAVGYGTTFAVPTSPNTVISGGVAYIAGGGGGCAGTSPGPGGSGGLGGGGRGDWADANITTGTPNTGGGGGGTRSHPDSLQTTGRNGGSGLVLVWY